MSRKHCGYGVRDAIAITAVFGVIPDLQSRHCTRAPEGNAGYSLGIRASTSVIRRSLLTYLCQIRYRLLSGTMNIPECRLYRSAAELNNLDVLGSLLSELSMWTARTSLIP